MTPSRLGSRGRPPRLVRGGSVRTADMSRLYSLKRSGEAPVAWEFAACHPVGRDTAARLPPSGAAVVHPADVGTICGPACGYPRHWEVPRAAGRALFATSIGHVLRAIARTAQGLGLSVPPSPGMLEVLDPRGGRGLERLFQRLARELTCAETEAVGVAVDPPSDGAALTARLLTAPTLAVERARRGVTVEVGVLAEAEFWSVYQPVVSLADRSVVAHEALLRGVVDGREVG